jgi:hypothetical protein
MTAPDLFARPEPPRRGTRLPSDWKPTLEYGGVLRCAQSGRTAAIRSAPNINVCSTISLRSPSVLIQPVGEPGGATNASPGSNHRLLQRSKGNG